MTKHDVALTGLSADLSGLRVVQLSDLHLGLASPAKRVRRAVELANTAQPDLVVITGDFVNYRSIGYLSAGINELRALHSPLGVYACLGNHEHWEGAAAIQEMLEAGGIRVLVNASNRVRGNLWLAAVDDLIAGQPDLARAVARVPDDAAVILLSHNPNILPRVADRPWLVLAGHTHGGQIALPFLGPRRTISLPGVRQFARFHEALGTRLRKGRVEEVSTHAYPAGWYEEGLARMYVNRGIGVSSAYPLRLNCPPEVSLFVLRPK